MKSEIKSKVLSGLIWKFGERISAQLVTFVVSVVLARLLSPSHYGAIAIVNVFIALANIFVSAGLASSLIQKKEADNLDFSTVFYSNVFLSIFIYLIVYFSAPFIADFYEMDILQPVLRVLGLRLIIGGINNVQHAYVSKKLLFKKFFWSTLGGTLVSGIVGIILAYKGFGIWALVAQYMVNTFVDTVVLWYTVRWRPILAFSYKRLTALFSYGWKILVSSFLDAGYNELRTIVIGKMYSSADLAFYNKGKSFPNLLVTNINNSIQAVLFPAMASQKDDKSKIKAMVRRSICVSSYVMLPLMSGLALVAEPFIRLLLTEKWLFCVPYLQIACFTYALFPIHTANLQAIKAIGRSDLYLKLEVIKKTIGIILLVISAKYGVMAIALSSIITAIISTYVNSFPNKKLIGYSYFEQIKDMFNGIIPLLFMSLAVAVIRFIPLPDILCLIVQIIVGILVYILVSIFTKSKSYKYLISSAKGFIHRK